MLTSWSKSTLSSKFLSTHSKFSGALKSFKVQSVEKLKLQWKWNYVLYVTFNYTFRPLVYIVNAPTFVVVWYQLSNILAIEGSLMYCLFFVDIMERGPTIAAASCCLNLQRPREANWGQANRNAFVRHCPPWQCSAAHYSCSVFDRCLSTLQAVWISLPLILISLVESSAEFWHRQRAADQRTELVKKSCYRAATNV